MSWDRRFTVAAFLSSHSLISLGKEKRISSPMSVFVFITSIVVDWWVMGASINVQTEGFAMCATS